MSLTLTIILLIRKKCSAYGAIALGLMVFMGLFLLDTTVVIRLSSTVHSENGFSLAAEYHRLIHGGTARRTEMLSNVAAFIPFGFFLSEFLASLNRTGSWRRVGWVVLAAFGLSLCIECLQLIMHVGFFELTDLVMNTVGAFVGAGVAILFRRFLRSFALGRNDNESAKMT